MDLKVGDFPFKERVIPKTPETHGVYCFVGPPGSGKTLLAVWMARQYTTGTVKRQNGICPCEDPECKETWKCYSNLSATWKSKDNPKGWALPLDVASAIMDKSEDLGHSIILLDEAYLFGMDSRRSQRNINVDAGYFVSQRRKLSSSTVKMYMTSQSIDMIDSRIRAQTSRIYNCWTDDSGVHVKASITKYALGHLPPWDRNKPPVNKKFYTKNSRAFYNQHELVDSEELMTRGIEPRIILNDGKGEQTVITMTDAIERTFFKTFVGSDITRFSSLELCKRVEEIYGWELSDKLVRSWLDGQGYMREKNSSSGEIFYNIQTIQKEVEV